MCAVARCATHGFLKWRIGCEFTCHPPPPAYLSSRLSTGPKESWLSGRKHFLAKEAYRKRYRGFESHTLRHFWLTNVGPCNSSLSCSKISGIRTHALDKVRAGGKERSEFPETGEANPTLSATFSLPTSGHVTEDRRDPKRLTQRDEGKEFFGPRIFSPLGWWSTGVEQLLLDG